MFVCCAGDHLASRQYGHRPGSGVLLLVRALWRFLEKKHKMRGQLNDIMQKAPGMRFVYIYSILWSKIDVDWYQRKNCLTLGLWSSRGTRRSARSRASSTRSATSSGASLCWRPQGQGPSPGQGPGGQGPHPRPVHPGLLAEQQKRKRSDESIWNIFSRLLMLK